jgi:hypothetical protein
MGFMFRVEQIAVTEETTVLTGHMIGGSLDWLQRIELQIGEEMKTVFTARLRGVASGEDTGLTLYDPSMWEKVLALPLAISRENRIDLILDGIPLLRDLPVPAIAVGVDASTAISDNQLQTAFRCADVPVWSGVNFGTPVREFPYQISRRGMLLFAPWGLFFVTIVLSLLFVAFAFNKIPLQQVSFGKIIACGLLGFFDVFFLYFSIKMLLAKPSPIVVTTSGIMMPLILPGFSGQNVVYVSFDEMVDMLEYRDTETVQMLKVKTARGIFHLNRFLMQSPHFEELRGLLWRKIRDNREQHAARNPLPEVNPLEEHFVERKRPQH